VPDHQAEQSCAVCGRTILRGEQVVDYLTPDGETFPVCALCRERAQAEGWVRADSAAAHSHARLDRRRRGLGLRKRGQALREGGKAMRERARDYADRLRPPERPEPDEVEAAPEQAPAPELSTAATAEPEAEPTPEPEPDTPERRMRRAIERFNDSDESRVVAGLIRSLGEPQVAVRDLGGRTPRMELIVAWELSWYRWEVGSNGEDAQIREVAKGTELSELEGEEPEWNAKVDGEGKLRWRESS
jgi:hypothetical protein